MKLNRKSAAKRYSGMKGVLAMILLMFLMVVPASAQPKKRPPFNPAKFEADLEQYITREACLTPFEASKFFPIYRQMMKKQRMLFDEMRRFRLINPKDNKACEEAIRRQDEIDIQIKQLQQEYHSRFMFVLSPSKVMGVIKAEEKFHRQAFREMK
jgi:hypothetical protein